ncbi:MAG: hypothetical protein L7W43_00250 [Rubripirellula sp.]|nr:hypothetical protein [Rhodopirellula sp.]MCH1438054.1 hypothetical protein [Rubripirellula sp.]
MLANRGVQATATAEIVPTGTATLVTKTNFTGHKELPPNVGHGFHWLGNVESNFLIGDAMGNARIRSLAPRNNK